MFIIPAIDLKDGVCVRLQQGKKDAVTVYSRDPGGTAKKFESSGAKVLHVVDLDGAFSGSQKNFDRIVAIRKAVKMKIEVGGGIRDISAIDKLVSAGVDRVIIGTSAIEDPEFVVKSCEKFPGKIFIGIDARDGMVATRGWEETSEISAKELAKRVQTVGVAGIIYTDIARDGMLTGPNLEQTAALAGAVGIPVIAAGGVGSEDDVRRSCALAARGVAGLIVGRALYTGALDLGRALEIAGCS